MLDSKVENYLKNLAPKRTEILEEMEQYAIEHHIPIMDLVGMESLLQILQLIQPKRVLEIGSAIGYSAIRIALTFPDVEVVTIERDQARYDEAIQNISKAQLQNRVVIKQGDALDVADVITSFPPFDVLFIDAAKGQYQRFFELYSPLVQSGGVILSDNVLFKGLVAEDEIENKRIRGMVKKLQNYNEWLINHPDYETRILPVGDGLAISLKK
ncbi:O-methyltransferase [Alkalihalobacillus trypoxylicola]|uniref:tRNA 5-hydroxyuridine methyltransferase n=1 Tax=Alkalihalobacillus trypoxylicola TaxID=519424 RepID=A0A162E6S3_9BACI|nr:O-methyltransferase [Alkalihalobacillus trypoxylicola]KYG31901.1 SAM-dependent methyltransferase [Alkalihalobacillus trypoxylicola]